YFVMLARAVLLTAGLIGVSVLAMRMAGVAVSDDIIARGEQGLGAVVAVLIVAALTYGIAIALRSPKTPQRKTRKPVVQPTRSKPLTRKRGTKS
ncbi:MAG: hypothetical protein AAFU50_10040, partial [Pseudomonadota bacterium]